MGKFRCPYCYEMHKEEDCIYKCSYNILGESKRCYYDKKDDSTSTNNTPNPQAGGNAPNTDNEHKDNKGRIKKKYYKQCAKCQHASLQVFCPYSEDNEVRKKYNNFELEIPKNSREVNGFSIALLGAANAGKTNYITVLVDEIKNKLCDSMECGFAPSHEATSNIYKRNFYDYIYNKSQTPQKTAAGIVIPPLIYSIDFNNPRKGKESVTLTLYDTAGEDLNDIKSMTTTKGYIANADGIIVLLDPLQVPSIRQKLEAKGVQLPPFEDTTTEILNRLINVFKNVKKIKGKIKVPIALAFSKIDMLEKYDIIPQGYCLRDESEHLKKRAFVKSDFNNTQMEMESLLDNFIKGSLKQDILTFENHAFFGISALGVNPLANGKIPEGALKPHRVLDPLIWLLAQEKYINTTK